MKKSLSLFFSLLVILSLQAQQISYSVSFPNITHHEAQISLNVTGIGTKQKTAVFRMSRSSPGRYATHEFGKNVYDVKAFGRNNKPLTVTRIEGDVYEVQHTDGQIRLEYTLYANHPDGTYAGIDATSIHFNMPAAFMWIRGYDKTPIAIKFNIPEGKQWSIATQLKPTKDSTAFTAPGLQYFMDSPTKIGSLTWKEWSLTNPSGKSYRIRFAFEGNSSDSLLTAFTNKVKRITEQSMAVFGELPDFDYGTYTFIASINPWVKGDGMEHRNSTVISIPINFDGNNELLGVFAHEFFHCWNVERIRPKTLEPFNFEKSNMSNELWFAEGFTQYYGDLLTERASCMTEDDYLRVVSGLINTKSNTQGAKRYSPVEVSRHAVFVDAGVAIDKSNYVNMYTSYYPYGAAIALALDLELRSRFNNLTLDNYMTAVWKKSGKTEIPYNVDGLQDVLAQLTGSKQFASGFFSKYIKGHEPLDYAPLLEKAGLLLKKANEGKAWIGNVQWKDGANSLTIASNSVNGTPLYNAGLDVDDQILSLNGKPLRKQSDLTGLLKSHKPGDKLDIEYEHRGNKTSTKIILGENPAFIVVPAEKPSAASIEFRKKWLGSR
ncbi:M61 family metallopeptidase [Pseudoflavitalea rhizosphaerae]|uniref:M61 family metallopeptidase n=1 Tax=Pseudoflavitalea rhizosphaerae TaxID=1884793 RepID=UPI000F8D9D87|nr:PDZ domain-containing protein [Pseudoflavitalea rhizosphaerae]